MYRKSIQNRPQHRGAILLLTVLLIVVLLGMIAFAVDLGYLMMAKTQLQAAADSAALAAAGSMGQSQTIASNAAKSYAAQNLIGNQSVQLGSSDITYGTWDKTTRTFTPVSSGLISNAAKVTAKADSTTTGAIPLFFGRILNLYSVNLSASATATCNPRDICFVVDLSGSMNNDTDPNNTSGINSSYPGVGTTMMQDIYSDFGYGTYPGSTQAIGAPLGVSSLASLTSTSSSPLLYSKKSSTKTKYNYTVPSQYLIYVKNDGSGKSADSSSVITQKAYSWVMDEQMHGLSGSSALPGIMPAAKPTSYALPSTGTLNTNYYNYWYAYLSANSSSIGYQSYMHYMMSYGRTLPTSTSTLYSPLSVKNISDCPYNSDTTLEGNTFSFPPREMPTHASRMAIIDALQIIKTRNQNITDSSQCDWVSIVTFDLTS
ncbi:MAG: pilus assembly protein TadG-related protein, partial [Thermoguttaceae bacterium]